MQHDPKAPQLAPVVTLQPQPATGCGALPIIKNSLNKSPFEI
jgi:hypothetical protein